MAPRHRDTVLVVTDGSESKKLLNGNSHKSDEKSKIDEKENEKEKNKTKGSSWKGFFKKMAKVWPYMWPRGKPSLQLRVIASVVILIVQRFINIAVPYLYKLIVEELTPTQSTSHSQPSDSLALNPNLTDGITTESAYIPLTQITGLNLQNNEESQSIQTTNEGGGHIGTSFCWQLICLYMFVKAFQGGSGYLNALRSFLWIRVAQNTKKTMKLKLFFHLHNLSLRWHLQRKTGEVLRVMDRGVSSITMILDHVLFNIFPAIFDIILAVIIFTTLFDVWTALIVLGTMIGYLVVTIVVSEWRVKFRREMNEADNKENATSVDSILNFETVKYYSAVDWEKQKYEKAIDTHQHGEWKVNASVNLLNVLQKTMMVLGLFGGSLVCAWYVYTGKFTVGDYVMFGAYVEQLYAPLNMFGAYYRMLQQALIDMENMYEMMGEEPEIVDSPDAKELEAKQGEIVFDNVTFGYTPEKTILHGISFRIPAGQTYALVGDSGGGKSTIIRLLFRFYDVTNGTITIDGQDINKVTQASLRKQIGVVPQDTVLFNKDIRYNIRYGRVTASDDDVTEAAKAAEIHDQILTFPDGYDSKVGERGLKVSGGEKQRIAIARTILKAPEIVLLDEATSALDTRTERSILSSFRRLCENKTTLIVAHRLSTIIHAHQILVVNKGRIVERGTHEELLSIEGGVYSEMWNRQLQNEGAKEDDVTDTCITPTNQKEEKSNQCDDLVSELKSNYHDICEQDSYKNGWLLPRNDSKQTLSEVRKALFLNPQYYFGGKAMQQPYRHHNESFPNGAQNLDSENSEKHLSRGLLAAQELAASIEEICPEVGDPTVSLDDALDEMDQVIERSKENGGKRTRDQSENVSTTKK